MHSNCQPGWIFLLLAQMMKLAQLFRKSPKILVFKGHKGHKAKKGQKGKKNKYGSKCLELSNSARNAKIAKKFQKVPKAWRSMDIRPNGLWSWNYIYIYVRNIMLIFIHHNLLNTIFRKKFEYDSRLKADLIKFIKLNSTFLNFYYHFEIPQLS